MFNRAIGNLEIFLADIRFNHGALFYRGIDQDGMCLFSQEDVQVQSEPDSPILTKPKESIQAFTNDEEATYNREWIKFIRQNQCKKLLP